MRFARFSRYLVGFIRLVISHPAESLTVIAPLLMTVNLVSTAWSSSITQDEIIHIPAGYYYLSDGAFELNNEHPPLAKILTALPLVFIRPVTSSIPPAPEKLDEQSHGMHDAGISLQFWNANSERFKLILFCSRLGAIVITLILSLVIFLYARELFGLEAAALAIILFSLEPTVLAHGKIVHTDMAAALAYTFFFYVLWMYWHHPNARWTIFFGVVTGLALVTKFSLIVVAPIFVIALLARSRVAGVNSSNSFHGFPEKVLAVLICLFVINAAYFFLHRHDPDVRYITSVMPGVLGGTMRTLPTIFVSAFSALLPRDYIVGLYRVLVHNQEGHPAYIMGRYGPQGWWYYFPAAFALKTTLPFLMLSVISLAWGLKNFVARVDWRFLAVLGPLAIYLGLAMTSRINIGIRHLLPAFPFLFIAGGALLDKLIKSRSRRAGIACASLLIALMTVEALSAWPSYLSYMNQLTWRQPHWYYLADSNLEWGQDVSDLAVYLRAHGITRIRGAMFCGTVTLPNYGIQYVDLLSPQSGGEAETEYIAIGANFLNGSLTPDNKDWFAAYRNRKSEAVFGNSIYLYRVKTEAGG